MAGFTENVAKPFLYVNGFQTVRASATTLTVASGQCRSSDNSNDIINLALTTTVSTSFVGVNGMDVGTPPAPGLLALYAIFDPTFKLPVAFVLSANFSNPILPEGYALSRRVRSWACDGSGNLLVMSQQGNQSQIYCEYDLQTTVVSAGTATTPSTLSLANVVPDNGNVYLNISLTPNAATSFFKARPFGFSQTTNPPIFESAEVASVVVKRSSLKLATGLNSGNPSIDWWVNTSDSVNVLVNGYDDYL